ISCRPRQEMAIAREVMTKVFGLPVFRPDAAIPFLRYAKGAFAASWLLIVAGLVTLGVRGKAAFGKDFRGGESTVVALVPGAQVDTGRVLAAASAAGLPDTTVTVQTPVGGGDRTLRIETSLTEDRTKGDFANVRRIVEALSAKYPEILRDRGQAPEKVMLS
ncbi:MAG: hypothetical protein ACKOY8_05515, partial [Verrucomicrobiota bacterium]